MTLSLFTVDGTFAPSDVDPGQYPNQVALELLPSDWQRVADALAGLATIPRLNWVPTDYPAAVYPMGASINKGVAQLVTNIAATPVGTPKALAGYSQGAIVTSTVWRDHILNPAGYLHEYLYDFVAAVNWGNPMRCPGVANGNTYAGWAIPSGGGISGNNLTAAEVPPWWLDFANPNDLYTDCPVGTRAGADETMIYNLIVTTGFGGTLMGLLRIVESMIAQFRAPIAEVVGIATAIFNGLKFLAAGPNAGHYTYDPSPAVTYIGDVAARYV